MTYVRLLVVLISLWVGMPHMAEAVALQSAPPRTLSTGCGPHAAQWEWHGNNSEEDDDPPAGTHVVMMACKLGPHWVRIHWHSLPTPNYRCGATERGELSAWVDGHVVISKAEFGDWESCSWGNSDQTRLVLHRLILNDRGHVTTCMSFETDKHDPDCHLETLKIGKSDYAPQHDGPIRRTRPALELKSGTEPLCRTAAALLVDVSKDEDDRFYEKFGIKSIGTSASISPPDDRKDTSEKSFSKTFALDIDNDGKPDQLIYVYTDNGREIPGLFSWTDATSHTAHVLDSSTLTDVPKYREFGEDIGFVTFAGRTYVYRRTQGLTSGGFYLETHMMEAINGSDPRPGITRVLYQVEQTGHVRPICSFASRPRPEEFM